MNFEENQKTGKLTFYDFNTIALTITITITIAIAIAIAAAAATIIHLSQTLMDKISKTSV